MRTRHAIIAAALLVVAAACSSDESTSSTLAPTSGPTTAAPETTSTPTSTGPTTSTSGSTTSVSPTTSGPTTSGPATSAPTTTAAVTSTTASCTFTGDTGEELDGFPERMTSMVGVDIRTGGHGCYERLVIELAPGSNPIPGGMPGWSVRYADGPIYLGESDETVDLLGDATLLVAMAAWMPTMEGDGYDGPTRIIPDNVSHLLELRQIENWEGISIWAVGLDRERPFRVFTLTQPSRLVVDIGV